MADLNLKVIERICATIIFGIALITNPGDQNIIAMVFVFEMIFLGIIYIPWKKIFGE